MEVNKQITGKMSIGGSFTVLVPDIEGDALTEEELSALQADIEELVRNLKRLSLHHKNKVAKTLFRLSANRYAVFAAKNGHVTCYLFAVNENSIKTSFGIEDAKTLAQNRFRIESRMRQDFSASDPVKYTTFDKRVDEINTMLLNTLANPPNSNGLTK